MITPLVLSGGAGTRLWPLSRELYPKQLLPLLGDRTMLQDTLQRLRGLADVAPPMVVCNSAHRFLVAEQLRQIDCEPAAIMLEPVGRNTAPAVAVAALQWLRSHDSEDADTTLLVLPADHVIRDEQAFHDAVALAARAASEHGKLVTFGITPTQAETGYGYIRAGAATAGGALAVEEFVEKPDAATAERYVSSGDYLWNSGMFMFSARRYLAELEAFAPEMTAACRAACDDARAGSRLSAAGRSGVCRLSERFDRLRGDGEDPRCGRRAADGRLERRRHLVLAVRSERPRMPPAT
jgi:mannose-1-phosphate guanylyltransferase/mannose-6-phosphate isomerase